MTPDPYRRLRARQDGTELAAGRRGEGPDSPYPALVGRVFANPEVPLTAGRYFSVHPVAVAGVEAESNPGALAVDAARTFLVYVIGPRVPVAGEDLVCRFVGNRWVAERSGRASPGGVDLPGCPCHALPPTLRVSVNRPELNFHVLQDCVLRYGPTPPPLRPLGLGDSSYLSTESYGDDLSPDRFWYHFTCYTGFYMLTRVYIHSIFGSPFRDTLRYKWVVGYPGNTCSPFLLSHGQIYVGGDPACVVTVSE